MSIIIAGKTPQWEYRWVLRRGQRAKVGRSPWADFCIEDDEQLRDFHCQVAVDQQLCPRVTAIDDAPISVAIKWVPTVDGREELQCIVGQTRLAFQREHHPNTDVPQSDMASDSAQQRSSLKLKQPSRELMQEIGLSEEACELVATQASLALGVEALVGKQWREEAVRYLAAGLQTHKRLHWCSQLLQQAGYPLNGQVAGLLQLWLTEPTESLRQAIAVHVDWNRKLDPNTWLMASISWTGGSLSPSSSIHVPPTEQMIITGVITALSLASAQRDADQFQQHAIEKGMEMLQT